uniref:hypothetical protein n=1 Tax=Nocardiopsis halotolerans TaxID=124252 RepID=UPI0004776AED
MPWDAQERTRYEDEVLVAARAHGLPADLFARYGIGPELERRLRDDPAAFTEHVSEVCAYWRDLQSRRRSLKKVLVDLIDDHERLEGEDALTHAHFHRVRSEATRRALTAWSEAAGSPTAHLVDRLSDLAGAPPTDAFHTLREHLRVRGVPFSPMEVFGERRLAGGFTVLDGFRLPDGTALDKASL